MGNILDRYKKHMEEDRLTENMDLPDEIEFVETNADISVEAYKKELTELRESDDDMERVYHRFHQTYVKMSESEMEEKNLIGEHGATVSVKHAYCPVCGKELVSATPVIFNPYTMERIAKHDCSCGYKCNLEYAYPRLVIRNEEGVEIKAFTM